MGGRGRWASWILVMAAFVIICMVMMARMMSQGMCGWRTRDAKRDAPGAPERILANRLASGEIDLDKYQCLKNALEPTRTTDRT